MSAECVPRFKSRKPTGVEISNARLNGVAQRFQARAVFSFPLLNEPQPFAQHITDVPVAATGDQLLDERCLLMPMRCRLATTD